MGPERLALPHLPPSSVAPILEFYDPEARRLDVAHLLEAPVDDRGVVKVAATLELALSHIDPEYKWSLDECDVHHFVWKKEDYSIESNGGDKIPLEYREVPFHKGYLPRELHNFIHTTIAPPIKPSPEVMKQRVDAAKQARLLFNVAQLLTRYDQRPETFFKRRRNLWRTQEIINDDDIFRETLVKLEEEYAKHIHASQLNNETRLFDATELESPHRAARHLGRFVARTELNLNPYVTSRRKVALAA